MVSQCTKFEVSRFTCYDAMNSSAKCRKWGSFGRLIIIIIIAMTMFMVLSS